MNSRHFQRLRRSQGALGESLTSTLGAARREPVVILDGFDEYVVLSLSDYQRLEAEAGRADVTSTPETTR